MTDFTGKIALVSGASRGLGFAVGKSLSLSGAQVLALARTVGGLEELDDAIGEAGGVKPVLIPADITDESAVQGLTDPLAGRFGHVDLWVHTAVYAPPLSPAEHMDPRDLDRSIATNLAAVERLILAVDPLLRRAPAGRAVFFDDPVADGVHAAYSAAKAGSAALVRAWGQSLSRTSPARVLVATPPPMHTAVRGRFHPGEPKDGLAHPRDVAARLLAHLAAGADSDVDLAAVP
ncbi:MAG: SDR family oxidoreductase [Pseudomonadota bacterium]